MDDEPLAHQRRLLGSILAGRRVVVLASALPGAARLTARLRELGATNVLPVVATRGTGDVDETTEAAAVVLGLTATGLMDGIRAFERALDDPPPELVAAVDAFDPDGAAWVLGEPFSRRRTLLGRPLLGARGTSWPALEDKTTVDGLWDDVGVSRAPSRVVGLDDEDGLTRAAHDLDAGGGTVWVADNTAGWHGGGHGLRRVRDGHDARRARAGLAHEAVRVRVMPFLDGVPCSIHGWVVGDEVIAFRPCEMVVLREAGGTRLHYAGAATTWLPRDEDRDAMRDVARRVGAHLRDSHDYRGVLTVDGVLTAEGFRPTELNPRFGAALGVLGSGEDLPLYLLHCATVEHPELDWRPAELEREALLASLRSAHAGAALTVDEDVDAQHRCSLWRVADGYRIGEEADDADGTVELGPAVAGGFLRVRLHDFALGPQVAPEMVAAFAAAAEALGIGLPRLEAAPDLRPRHPRVPG